MRVKNCFFTVQNMDRAAKFYSDVLGWPMQFQDGQRWAQFKLDGFTVALAASEESSVAPGANAVMTVEVEDLHSVLKQLAAANVQAGPIRDMGSHGLTADFKDPEGNTIQLYQASLKNA